MALIKVAVPGSVEQEIDMQKRTKKATRRLVQQVFSKIKQKKEAVVSED